jgi:hypothetical protein
VQQIHLSVKFGLSLHEEYTLTLFFFITTCTAAAKKRLAKMLGVKNEIRPLFKVLNQKFPS